MRVYTRKMGNNKCVLCNTLTFTECELKIKLTKKKEKKSEEVWDEEKTPSFLRQSL